MLRHAKNRIQSKNHKIGIYGINDGLGLSYQI